MDTNIRLKFVEYTQLNLTKDEQTYKFRIFLENYFNCL